MSQQPAGDPGCPLPARDASGSDDRTQQRNTHSTESRVVRYRWHPWFGQEVWVHQVRRGQRSPGPVLRCGLTPDLDAKAVEIPLWMFDAEACGAMWMATAPVVNTDALHELTRVLEANHATCGVLPQAEHLIASGGAHGQDRPVVAAGDTTIDLSGAPAESVVGGDAARTPPAGRTPAGPHDPRTRAAARRTATGGGAAR